MKINLTILIITALLVCQFSVTAFAQTDRKLERQTTDDKAEKRVALVIGNGEYTKAKPLPNPANDANDMAATLKTLGFEVFSGTNLDKKQMEKLIRDFGSKLANGGTGLFYYAGHGIQVGSENYLVPIDADIPEEDEVSYSAVPLNLVLTKMNSARNDLNLVILDACRNNPFARSWRSFRDNSNNDGLAKVSPPTGTLVLYATEPGKVASDGAGRNGLFTEALLKQIKKPNLEYDQMVKQLSAEVWQKSNKQQLPWKEGNTLADFYFVKVEGKATTGNQPTISIEKTKKNKTDGTNDKTSVVENSGKLTAVLKTSVSTKAAQAGDRFTMEVITPSELSGAIIEGHIAQTQPYSKISGEALIWLKFELIRYRNGQTSEFHNTVDQVKLTGGEIVTVINGKPAKAAQTGAKTNQTDEEKTRAGINSSLGSLVGAIANNGKGATTGAVIIPMKRDGSDTPLGTILLQGRDDINLDNKTEFIFIPARR